MPHSAAALREALHLVLDAKKQLADLGGKLLLKLGDGEAVALRVPAAIREPIPGLDGIWWSQLPCAYPENPTCTRLMVDGITGAICPTAQVPHGVKLVLLEGALFWWQASFGRDEAGERIYRRFDKGGVWELEANEEHGFVVLEHFLSYNTFAPYFH